MNFETMQAEVNTKGGGTRFIELDANAVAILSLCDRSRPLVFDATNRRWLFQKALEEAEIDDLRWHDLRHTFATWLGSRGKDIVAVMKSLGHSNVATTMKYRHVIRTDVQAALEKMPTIIEGKVVQIKKAEGE